MAVATQLPATGRPLFYQFQWHRVCEMRDGHPTVSTEQAVAQGVQAQVLIPTLMDSLILKAKAGVSPATVIMDALRLRGVYTFTDLFDSPAVAEFVKSSATKESQLLSLFCAGTLGDYRAQPQVYGTELEAPLLEKLKLLTLTSLAEQFRELPYSQLQGALELHSDSEVEKVVLQAVYSGLVEVRGWLFFHVAFTPLCLDFFLNTPLPSTIPSTPSHSPITGPAGPETQVFPRQGLSGAGCDAGGLGGPVLPPGRAAGGRECGRERGRGGAE